MNDAQTRRLTCLVGLPLLLLTQACAATPSTSTTDNALENAEDGTTENADGGSSKGKHKGCKHDTAQGGDAGTDAEVTSDPSAEDPDAG